uniref:Uncharacterized protein n=1 Tax=Callorhinchus milii TaxID=7868 RepID=A0A4W3HA34_CALMI
MALKWFTYPLAETRFLHAGRSVYKFKMRYSIIIIMVIIILLTWCDTAVRNWTPCFTHSTYSQSLSSSSPTRPLHGLAPSYLSDLLSPYLPARTLRSSGSALLHTPRPNRPTIGGRAFISQPRGSGTPSPGAFAASFPFLLQGRSRDLSL